MRLDALLSFAATAPAGNQVSSPCRFGLDRGRAPAPVRRPRLRQAVETRFPAEAGAAAAARPILIRATPSAWKPGFQRHGGFNG